MIHAGSWTSWLRKWDTTCSKKLDIKCLTWHLTNWFFSNNNKNKSYMNTPYRRKREATIVSRTVFLIPPLPPVSPYHFPRLFTANTTPTLPELIMCSQTAIFCQVLPHGLGLTVVLATQHPRRQRGWRGSVVCCCWWWCAESGGVTWCHPMAWRGPIKPWENYVTFCWVGPFSPIEVQWIGSCREVTPPPKLCMCVCVWEKVEEKKRREASKQGSALSTC